MLCGNAETVTTYHLFRQLSRAQYNQSSIETVSVSAKLNDLQTLHRNCIHWSLSSSYSSDIRWRKRITSERQSGRLLRVLLFIGEVELCVLSVPQRTHLAERVAGSSLSEASGSVKTT